MKVKELIELLKEQDLEKDVLIQQGEEYDYMTVHSVLEKDMIYTNSDDEEEEMTVIVIEYE